MISEKKLSKIGKNDVDHKKGSKSKAIGKSILQRFVVTVVSTDGVPARDLHACVPSSVSLLVYVC